MTSAIASLVHFEPRRITKSRLLPYFCFALLVCNIASGQEGMTVSRFKRIVAKPGDSTPLTRQLAAVPFWEKAKWSNSMKYQDGRTVEEECLMTAKTIQGRYLVFTTDSQYYKQPMHVILTYDERSRAYKQWGLFGTGLTEATVVFDFDKKITASTSTYEPGFMEISLGTFSDKELSERSYAYKNGELVLTRDSTTRPITQASAESGSAPSATQPSHSETNRPSEGE